MATVQTVLDALEKLAPSSTAFSFDKVGLQVGEADAPVASGAVALDCSEGLFELAKARGAQVLVCHHPLIWEPLATINSSTRAGRLATRLIREEMAFIAAHTNWDCARGGINDELARLLGLRDVRAIGGSAEERFLKLAVFVPKGSEEGMIEALSSAGAGLIGMYERCAFMSEGTGTYRGLPDSNPAIGQAGRIERAEEIRLEMRLPAATQPAVEAVIRRVHPYEEPAYDLFPLQPVQSSPITRIGGVERATLSDFQARVDRTLATRCWAWGDPRKPIERVAVCGGAADEEWKAALSQGADAFLTGEVKHHLAIEASEAGIAMLAAGHYATEHPGCAALARALEADVPEVEWTLFEPPPGVAGRPIG
jgi:dinuclear metal center YbgI/SA1388 family protein